MRKQSNVVLLGLFSAEARYSERLNPISSPQRSARIMDAALMVEWSPLSIIKAIFVLTWEGKIADFSLYVVPLYTLIPLNILFHNTASIIGPKLPFSNH